MTIREVKYAQRAQTYFFSRKHSAHIYTLLDERQEKDEDDYNNNLICLINEAIFVLFFHHFFFFFYFLFSLLLSEALIHWTIKNEFEWLSLTGAGKKQHSRVTYSYFVLMKRFLVQDNSDQRQGFTHVCIHIPTHHTKSDPAQFTGFLC